MDERKNTKCAQESLDFQYRIFRSLTPLSEASRLGIELGVAVHVDALTIAQLVEYRDHVVPRRPVKRLVDVAPILVVQADGTVIPLTHGVKNRLLCVGSLLDGRLASLTRDWIHCGKGEDLAAACECAWIALTADDSRAAVYWYDEVAKQTGGE